MASREITQVVAPGVEPVAETRSFEHKRDALAWLYTGEEAGEIPAEEDFAESNPRPPRKRGRGGAGFGMARRYRGAAGTDDCRPRLDKAEYGQARAKADQFFNLHHRAPSSKEANAEINDVYASVYPGGPYPIPSASHKCAKNWMMIRSYFNGRIKERISDSKKAAAPRWWMRGGPVANPIPGSVGYNGYFHGSQGIPGSVGYNGYDHGAKGIPGSVGYNGYTANPSATAKRAAMTARAFGSPQQAMAAQMQAQATAHSAAQQHKLNGAGAAIEQWSVPASNPSPQNAMARMLANESQVNRAAQQRTLVGAGVAVAEQAGPRRPRLVPTGARPTWAGQQSASRVNAGVLFNPRPPSLPDPDKKPPCADPCVLMTDSNGKWVCWCPKAAARPGRRPQRAWSRQSNPCCGSCAVGAACEGGCSGHSHAPAAKAHGACCDSCADGGPCEGCGKSGGCDCKAPAEENPKCKYSLTTRIKYSQWPLSWGRKARRIRRSCGRL